MRRFIGVFARADHPLALFLDDLQWLDSATLELVHDLLSQSELKHLLLIGAYRNNEVDESHPLRSRLDGIRKGGARVQEIALAPLTCTALTGLVTDTFRSDTADASALTELIHQKTAGNPFFAVQFISALVEEGLVAFDYGGGGWRWDVNSIRAKGYAYNVVELMVAKFHRLSLETQQALQLLACMGNSADLELLALVAERSSDEIQHQLGEPIRAGLVIRSERAYSFLHDRVQEAAYSLIPEEARAQTHLRIGRLLVKHVVPDEQEEAIFEIVNQFNRGTSLVISQQEREKLAELNLFAGKRAKSASAFASALTYFTAGRALLSEDVWELRQPLVFELELHRTDCEVWIGALPSAEVHLAELARRAEDVIQRAAVASRRVELYTQRGESDHAVAVGLEYLRCVDIDWTAHPTQVQASREYERIWSNIGNRKIEDLSNLPLMQDAEALATVEVLSAMGAPTLYTDENLYALTICRAANLSFERGNSDAAAPLYAASGLIAGYRFGDYDAGYRLARMACELAGARGLKRQGGKAYVVFAMVVPWTRPIRAVIDPARRAFQMATEQGDATYAAYACHFISYGLLASGAPLDRVAYEAELGLEFAGRVQFAFIVDILSITLTFVRMLRGETTKFGSLDHDRTTERLIEEKLTGHPALVLPECFYWIRKLQARFFAGHYVAAVGAAEEAQKWFTTSATLQVMLIESADFHFYAALSRAACCEPGTLDSCAEHREALSRHHAQLRTWAASGPENFQNREALVAAEIARIEGRSLDAEQMYENAIRSARANGFVQNEALAYETAARFHAARGFHEFADLYLRRAREIYANWGAGGKVRQLDEAYPHLGEQQSLMFPASTIGAQVERLDLATVIKVSQAVSGEMILEKLIDILMRTAIEHAGAERGVLILSRGAEQRMAAEAITHGETVLVKSRDAALSPEVVPMSVLQYVIRTLETVIVEDASTQNSLSGDPYISQRRSRSILSLPLTNRGKLIGVLYLENNLAPRVFAPARITVLKLLASQAAISLENTQLYRELAEREAKIRQLVDANIIGIFIWQSEGQILEANDAFLQILGYDREDLASGLLRWTALSPPEWVDSDARMLAEIESAGTAPPYEKEYFRKDGSRVPVLVGWVFTEDSNHGVAFVLDLTESKRAELALRESEGRWRATFDANPTMYFMVDRAGTIDSVNGFGAAKLGYSKDELLGRSWLDTYHESDRGAVLEHMEDCFRETGRVMHWEAHRVSRNGTVIEVRETANAVIVRGRAILFITCEDTTERKRVEHALRQSEVYLTEAQRLTHTGSWAYNHAAGKTIYWSNEAFRMFGLDPELRDPPNQKELRQLLHPDDVERIFEELEQIFRDKAEYNQEYRVVMPDGTVRHLHSIGHPVLGSAGELLEYFGTVIDVTERKHTEQRLLVQQRVTHILADAETVEEATPQILEAVCEYRGLDLGALWRIDREAGVLRCAELWRRPSVQIPLFEASTWKSTFRFGSGLPGQVWSNKAPLLIPHVGDYSYYERAAIAAGEGLHSACAFPILLGGEVLGVIDFIGREVQRPERALIDLFATLGSQIGQFIERKRAENALQLAQTELAHVSRVMTMGELTASIAHEVNQPLGAIVTSAASCARWLMATPPNMGKALRALERIANDGKRASEVIRRIRGLMKRQPPRKGLLDINETILEVLAIAQYQVRRDDILLETRLAEGLPRVQGDRVQLQQVLLNLIVNAVEAMSGVNERRRELTIVTTADPIDGVQVEVSDSGTGLDPERATRLFEPFYTTKAEGIGIGLSISRSIVEAHGGHLSAAANAPHGAVFRFLLPLKESIL